MVSPALTCYFPEIGFALIFKACGRPENQNNHSRKSPDILLKQQTQTKQLN